MAYQYVDLVAMSSRGRGGLERLILGSVATSVLQTASVPVLLHRPRLGEGMATANGQYRRILVPLDGSELAELVLPQVVAIAKASGAEVILLNVMPAQGLTDPTLATTWRTAGGEAQTAAEYLALVQSHLAEQGITSSPILRAGLPAEQIVLAAGQQQSDLIAMSTHARSTFGRLIRGSVADAVLRSTVIPMLLARSVNVPARSMAAQRL